MNRGTLRSPLHRMLNYVSFSMHTRRRVQTRRVVPPKGSEVFEDVKPQFADVMVGSVNEFVALLSRIPLTNPRGMINCGVSRLMVHLNNIDGDSEHGFSGMALGSNLPMEVGLSETRLHYVREHFVSTGMKEKEIKERVTSRGLWYGMIYGAHIQA